MAEIRPDGCRCLQCRCLAALAAWVHFQHVLGVAIILLSAALVLCWLRPRWFRPIYRAVMTASFYMGQVMGRVLLAIFFVVALTPLALVLRLFGKDLLRLKRDTKVQSYWRPAKVSQDFDRQF